MVREIITLSIGECGVKSSQDVWKRYCCEHGIQPDGSDCNNNNYNVSKDKSYETFFDECHWNGRLIARNIMCDFDSDNIDTLLQSEYRNIFGYGNSYYTQTYDENCANIFARGFHSIGKHQIDSIDCKIRRIAEQCDNMQGFIINHCISGGTSSGLTALILEGLSNDYRRKIKMGFEVMPSSNNNVLDPYNMALAMHNLIDFTQVSVMFDNNALYNQCKNYLNIQQPTFDNLNELISKTIAGLTQTLRFAQCTENTLLKDWETNYVPFPRLHFLTPSLAPIAPKYNVVTLIDGFVRQSYWNSKYNQRCLIYNDIMNLLYTSYNIKSIECNAISLTQNVLNSQNYLVEYPHFNAMEHKYMSCGINYRLSDTDKISCKYLSEKLNNQKWIDFIEWIPHTKIRYDIMNENKFVKLNKNINCITSDLCNSSATMVANNTAFGGCIQKRILNNFNLLFDRQAFVHWYYCEGMEQSEFCEARQDLEWLCMDYMDVLKEAESDEDSDDEIIQAFNTNDYILNEMNEQQMIEKAIKDSLNELK